MDSYISLFDELFDFSGDIFLLFQEFIGMQFQVFKLGTLLFLSKVELFANFVLELRIDFLTLFLDLIKFGRDLVELVSNFFV